MKNNYQPQDEFESAVNYADQYRKAIYSNALNLIGAPSSNYYDSEFDLDPNKGLDCSGFVTYVVTLAGLQCDVDLECPRHANEQFDTFGTFVDFDKRRAGDLLFFVRNRQYSGSVFITIGHVAILTSNNSYVHSPGKNGAKVSKQPVLQQEILKQNDKYANSLYIKRPTLLWQNRWRI